MNALRPAMFCVLFAIACRSDSAATDAAVAIVASSALPGAEAPSRELEKRLRDAIAAKARAYVPRTHHRLADGAPKFTNRLIFETSPYLLQHAHNPVDWRPWGEDAFALARRLDRPILLSVGYSTCHWCHVMERESFEDLEIAAFINSNFIAIKVDREERPDVDSVYMRAVQLMTGRGGWPMTVVLTPAREPFFGGTYLPARDGDRGAQTGLLSVLRELARAYREEKAAVVEAATRISHQLASAAQPRPLDGVPPPSVLLEARDQLAARFDPEHGGFGGAPKFPRPSTFELLLRVWRRTQDERALHIVTHSLAMMQRGGIYDHIGGGFHRYSTDAQWLVPHFEKMLYDNAQLVIVYLEAYQATGEESFRRTAEEILEYVAREMTSPDGAFFSATDADSEGEEGRFFTWTSAELGRVLGSKSAALVATYYGVTDQGNFEGRNILHRPRPLDEVARELAFAPETVEEVVQEAKAKLYAARETRHRPLLDDKILTEWNAQMISAFARAGLILGSSAHAARAERAARFLLARMQKDGRLLRAYREGEARHLGVLEDYAFLANGLLDLFEASPSRAWLDSAITIVDQMLLHFEDPKAGALFATANDAEALLAREKPSYDGAQPSGNAMAALALLRLYELTDQARFRRSAERIFSALGAELEDGAKGAPRLASALDFLHDEPKQIAIIHPRSQSPEPLLAVVRRTFLPNAVVVTLVEDEDEGLAQLVPWLEGKRTLANAPTAYVCTRGVCLLPARTPDKLAKQLAVTKQLLR